MEKERESEIDRLTETSGPKIKNNIGFGDHVLPNTPVSDGNNIPLPTTNRRHDEITDTPLPWLRPGYLNTETPRGSRCLASPVVCGAAAAVPSAFARRHASSWNRRRLSQRSQPLGLEDGGYNLFLYLGGGLACIIHGRESLTPPRAPLSNRVAYTFRGLGNVLDTSSCLTFSPVVLCWSFFLL